MSTTDAAKGKLERASGKVQETAQPATGEARQRAQEIRGQAGSRLRQQVDNRSTQVGEQVQSLAQAVRGTGEQLRSQGSERQAKAAEQAAERAERLAGYLQESDADRILGDVEGFARRQPWLIAALGAGMGFLAARFLKASSRASENGPAPARGLPPGRWEEEPPVIEPQLVTAPAAELPSPPVEPTASGRRRSSRREPATPASPAIDVPAAPVDVPPSGRRRRPSREP
jgi:uncharacterized protein YjbJ (UPF0337 family)